MCPFHADSNPSFTYSPEKGLWRCWSTCSTGGDVIALHRKNYKLSNNEEALISLAELLGIPIVQLDFKRRNPKLTPLKNEHALLVAIADKIAKTPEDYLELDYIMSMHKDLSELNEDLRNYIELRGHDVLFQLTRKINKIEE